MGWDGTGGRGSPDERNVVQRAAQLRSALQEQLLFTRLIVGPATANVRHAQRRMAAGFLIITTSAGEQLQRLITATSALSLYHYL